MPTIMSHAAVPIAVRLGLGADIIPRRLMVAGIAIAMLPDADVAGFALGVDYAHIFGHRGLTHSLGFAAVAALSVAAILRVRSFLIAWAYLFAACASHALLDMFTNGGLGVALFWPFNDARIFAPFRPIEVSPIGVSGFLSARGAAVLLSELIWLWLPLITAGIAGLLFRKRRRA